MELSFETEFRDRAVAAPLKPRDERPVARRAVQFRDRAVAAPLKLETVAANASGEAAIPRPRGRGPIEAIFRPCRLP